MSNAEVENVGWDSHSVTQQNQIKKNGVDISAYPLLTRSTTKEFPIFWSSSELGNLVSKAHTGLVRSANEQSPEYEYAYLKMNNLSKSGRFDLTELAFVNASEEEVKQYTLHNGDLIFNTRNSVELVGKCGVFYAAKNSIMLFNNNLLRINFFFIEPKIISYWLNSPLGKDQLRGITSATTSVAAIYQKSLMNLVVPVIPLAEQLQIAAKLDELLAQVDSIKTRLSAIPKILKRFRQSVLADAVSGKLTVDWRLQSGFEIQSSSDSWSQNNFGDLYQLIDGDRGPNYPKQTDYLLNGYCLFLSTKNVRPFGFLFDDPIYISENKHKQLRNGTLQVDDVVITTRGTLGNVAVYDSLIAKRFPLVRINSGMLIIREKTPGTVLREYLKLFIASPHFADQLTAKQTGSAQPQIPAGILKTFSIGVPKLVEQQEIVRRVEQLFTYADQIEQRVKDAQARVNHLTQAILAKAFRGELTADWRAQNPDLICGENSADYMLSNIQNESKKLRKLL